MSTPDQFNQRAADKLPGHLGITITQVSNSEVRAELPGEKTRSWRPMATCTPAAW